MERKSIYRGGVVDLGLETVELPNGELAALEIVRHPGGAVVLAIDDDERVCLLRQFRHAAGGWIWELPAGTLHENEQPLDTAKRELKEEAGLEASHWEPLDAILPSPGFCTEELFLFRARKLTSGKSNPEASEFIEVHWKPYNDALKMARMGEIKDAKTVVTLFRADKNRP